MATDSAKQASQGVPRGGHLGGGAPIRTCVAYYSYNGGAYDEVNETMLMKSESAISFKNDFK